MSIDAAPRPRASERVYEQLRDDIQRGSLAPGVVLGEVEQAARLGVSRTPLREALGRLEVEGLVVQRSPRVTVVADIDTAQIRDLFALRRALEEAAARLAAQRRDPRFADLAAEFDASDPVASPDAYYALIARFDAAIDGSIGNAFLARALQPVRAHLVRVRGLARDQPERLRASATEHALVARAIAAGDADLAAHATHVHLHNALTSIERAIATMTSPIPTVGAPGPGPATGAVRSRSTSTERTA